MTDEQHLCLHCMATIPTTGFHLREEQPCEALFRGKVRVERAASWFYFSHDGQWRRLIHRIKYDGRQACARWLGYRYACELAAADWLSDIDIIVPVPLHKSRQRSRGYNQSECIAQGIAEQSGISMDALSLQRIRQTDTQTRKSPFERWRNTEAHFSLINPDTFIGKHVLIVDDVITTGATLSACATEFESVQGCRITLLSLAFATLD